MHLPPNPPPERSFAKVRFGLILIATAGAFFGFFVSSNSGSLRVDASDKTEGDRLLYSLLKEREKFQQELQPEKEEIKSDRSSEIPQEIDEFPQEIFATLKPVPRLDLSETSPLNLSEIRGDRRTDVSPVDENKEADIPPPPPFERGEHEEELSDVTDGLAADVVTDVTDGLNEGDKDGLAADVVTDVTDGLNEDDKDGLAADVVTDVTDVADGLSGGEKVEEELKAKENNLLEYWNLPPRNSAADLLASGKRNSVQEIDNTREVIENSGENESEQNAPITITLNDAILLALENNRELKNEYLNRIIQRNQLEVAEDIFAPDFTPTVSLEVDGSDNDLLPFPNSGGLNLSANVALRLPNGTTISLTGNANSRLDGDNASLNAIAQNLELSVIQPLLRDAGSELNRLPIKRARLQEKSNVLQLKSSVINTITDVIRSYRGLVQSQQQLIIAENALEDTKQRLEDINILIEFGREARVEAVPFQREIARGELAVLNAQSSLESQKLNLIDILDLERDLEVVAEDILEVENPELNLEEITEIALSNQPSYLQAQINIQTAEFDLLQAENALRWRLDLDASYNNAISTLNETTGGFRAGVSLSQEFGDLKQRKLDLKQSQIGLVQAQNNLLEERQNLEISVANAVRDVKLSLEEVELARLATELAEQQLQIERDKLELGAQNASSNDVVEAQERLVDARNAELAANIGYLNSLTNLWQTLGTTLDELGIEFDDGLAEVNFEED